MINEPAKRNERSRTAIVAGMPRSGTTTLHHIFDDHPNVYVPFRKEVSFFTFKYNRGIDWYERMFRRASPDMLRFDISGNYFLCADTIDRILNYDPDSKVIISVRDPAEVAVSFYRLMLNWDFNLPPFEEYLENYTYHFGRETLELDFGNDLIIRNLNKFRKQFGDNLLLIDFTLFKQDMLAVTGAIEKFIGVPHYFTKENLSNQRINGSNRRNSRLLMRVLSKEPIAAALHGLHPEISPLFPERAVKTCRKKLDRFRVRKGDPLQGGPEVSQEQREMAAQKFKSAGEQVRQLFSDHPILYGSGAKFE